MKINLTSDEINLLVYRYLIENGFVHTAFSFNSEANVPKNPFFTTQMERVPPNALVGFLQKALLYIYLEYHTSDDTGEEIRCEEPFSIFKKHECWCRPLEQIGSNSESAETQHRVSNVELAEGEGEESMRIDNVSDSASKDFSAQEDGHQADADVQPPAKKTRKSKSVSSNAGPDKMSIDENSLEPQTAEETSAQSRSHSTPLVDPFQDNPEEAGSTVVSKDVPSSSAGNSTNSPSGIKGEGHAGATQVKQVKNEKSPRKTSGGPSSHVAMEDGGHDPGSDEADASVSSYSALLASDKYLSDVPHIKLFRKGDSSSGIREAQFSKRPESPNKLVITWEEGCPELWEIDPSSKERDLKNSILLPVSEGDNMIAGTTVTMSNNYIVIGYENGSVTLFSYNGRKLTTIRGSKSQEHPIVSLKLSESNEYLAVGDSAGSVMILRIKFEKSMSCYTTQLVNKHRHKSAIFGLCWCNSDSFLLSGCLDRQITVLDLRSNKVKSFTQEGPVLSINQVGRESSLVTCVLEGVSTVPVLKISKGDDIRLECVARISVGEGDLGFKEGSGLAAAAQSQTHISFIESKLVGNDKVFHVVATPYSVNLFDEECTLVSCRKITSKGKEPKEVVSICIDNKSNTILAGLNDGSVTLLELPSLRVKSRFLEQRRPEKKDDALSTGVGTVSINSSGNLVFVGGPELPAIYSIFSS